MSKGEDFFALDGLIHVKSETEVIYMGSKLTISTGEEAMQAVDVVVHSEASRMANVNCKASTNGVNVTLVTVSGDGQPPTYWIVTNTVGGNNYHATPYPYGQIGYADCRSLYQAAIFP